MAKRGTENRFFTFDGHYLFLFFALILGLLLGKWSDWHKNWYEGSLGVYLNLVVCDFSFFLIFYFLSFYGHLKPKKRGEMWKNEKIAKFQRSFGHKIAKKDKKSKIAYKFRYTPKDPSYQFLGQSDHFPRRRPNFRVKIGHISRTNFPIQIIRDFRRV